MSFDVICILYLKIYVWIWFYFVPIRDGRQHEIIVNWSMKTKFPCKANIAPHVFWCMVELHYITLWEWWSFYLCVLWRQILVPETWSSKKEHLWRVYLICLAYKSKCFHFSIWRAEVTAKPFKLFYEMHTWYKTNILASALMMNTQITS